MTSLGGLTRLVAMTIGIGLAAASILALPLDDARGAAASASASSSSSKSLVADAGGPVTQIAVTPRVQRVLFEVAPGGAVVTHDLLFAKGALTVAGAATSGEASLFVAFTAQARPLAVEAKRYALDDAGKLVESSAAPLPIADVVARPANAALILGGASTAGHVIKLPRGDAPFLLRVRSAIPLELSAGAKDVDLMARLGVRQGASLPLDRIEVVGTLGVTIRGALARLCGPNADPTPLVVEFPGYPPTPTDAGAAPVSSIPRAADDDLCVRVLF